MHNHNGKNNKSMLWMMIPCLLLVVVVLLGGGKLASSNYLWLIMLGVCVIPHLWMMFKGGHGEHSDNSIEDKIDDTSGKHVETKNEDNKHSGSCH